jgi:hypothetical protein
MVDAASTASLRARRALPGTGAGRPDLDMALRDCDAALRARPGSATFFDSRGIGHRQGDPANAISNSSNPISGQSETIRHDAVSTGILLFDNLIDSAGRSVLSLFDKEREMDNPLITSSWVVVRIGLVLNRLFLAMVVIGLVASRVFAIGLARFLADARPGVDAASELIGLRFEMAIGIVMAIATDRLLAALARIIASARLGDPFDAANALRLRTIGWALLVLQSLDIAGMLLGRLCPSLGSAAPDTGISVGGWVAVLMVFVLGRVFAAGAAMRADLDGTI